VHVTVYGLWHLGCVTGACLSALGHTVVGLDCDEKVVRDLQHGNPPLHEPGLTDLIAREMSSGRLSFTTDAKEALANAEILWVTFDTPVNERDEADVGFIRAQLDRVKDAIRPGTLMLISSQVPAGFTRDLERAWAGKDVHFAYSPENLRLGKAIEVFNNPERVIIGRRSSADEAKLAALFSFCKRIEWMSVESAEMTKHALNAFLATSVALINELARLCEVTGADAKEVERGLKSEGRIGPKAYLAPGQAFAGGTLARDVNFLMALGTKSHVTTPLFAGVLASNEVHKNWTRDRVMQLLHGQPSQVAVLGLTYKPGTNTLRQSTSVDLCRWLNKQGMTVRAHDPAITEVPPELQTIIQLCPDPEQTLHGSDLAILATEWPEFKKLSADDFVRTMRHPRVLDPNWFLASALANDSRITYLATGRAQKQETP
jgi:UDPglucose 6-dehydrogenase